MKYRKLILILIIAILVITAMSIFIYNNLSPKDVNSEVLLNQLETTKKIELYVKGMDTNNIKKNYRKIKNITDKKEIDEIIELLVSCKDFNSKDMNLYYRGHLLKFIDENDQIIAEYNETYITNGKIRARLEMSVEIRQKILSYYE